MELLSCTATLPGGSGQRNSCNALPHCFWAVGIGAPALHRHTFWRQWAGELLQRTASLHGGSGQWNSCHAPPHYLGAVGSGKPAVHCLTAWGQWAVQLLHMHFHTAQGRWAAELLQCTASLLVGSGQWSSCFAPPHFLEAVGCGTPATHCLTAWGQWAVELLSCTATLPRGSGKCNSCKRFSYCQGAVGRATPAMRGPISWGAGESCPGGGRCLKSGTPKGMVLGTGACAHPTLLVRCLEAVPGPCRPGLRTRHPAHG